MTLAEAPARTGFHTLRVAGVERLCDDAVAVTFEVPERPAVGLRVPRRGSTSRCGRVRDGVEERRSYSICAPAGAAPRVGVRG